MRPILTLVLLIVVCSLKSQTSKKSYYHAIDYDIGKIMPVHSMYPKTEYQQTLGYSFGKIHADSLISWNNVFNFPHTGVLLSLTDNGNRDVFGYTYNLMPFVVFNTSQHGLCGSHFKLGLGGSYYTNKYAWPENRRNWSIGSHLTISFVGGYYYGIFLNSTTMLTLGAKYMHSSNGHTQLPNFGMNSWVLSTGVQFLPENARTLDRIPAHKTSKSIAYYVTINSGWGWHELGDAAAPKFGPKYPVYSFNIDGSKVYNKSIRLKLGLTYRFYDSYYSYINEKQLSPFNENSAQSASNVFAYIGGELLFGHVGAELELGINLTKPFYDEFNNIFEFGEKDLAHTLKTWIPARLGLKYYAISTSKSPQNNIVVASHINANFTNADFFGFSIGYVRKL